MSWPAGRRKPKNRPLVDVGDRRRRHRRRAVELIHTNLSGDEEARLREVFTEAD